ncbi:hypothetical protein [Limnothrix redekei]|uniref:hypothetical protein n=1 Tax=Limnothrix redekei TaxID=132606 RepID=UPI003710E16D
MQFPSLLVTEKTFMGLPGYVTDLEAIYGAPSQEGFGSAVFYEVLQPEDDLNYAALRKYEFFVGDRWSEAYQNEWTLVYGRSIDATRAIVSELGSLSDNRAQDLAYLITDNIDEAAAGQRALAAAYDDPSTIELTIHKIGDGDVMSGLVIAGRRANGEATFLVFLID